MTLLHFHTANKRKRTRRMCPYHKHLEYGELQEFYDTVNMFFDCGTQVDYGYSEWRPPPKTKCPKCRKWFRPLEMVEHLKEHNRIKKLE